MPEDPALVPGAVVRISRGSFDPSRLAEIEEMTRVTGEFLVPAITRLDGLLAYYAAVSPDGLITHVSVWRSDEHASQMAALPEMVVDARQAAEALGVVFEPIKNYDIAWHV